MMARSKWVGLTLLGLGALVYLWRPAAARRLNVVVIVIDTLRSDHTSAYGYWRETMPELGRFADEGARFELAYAPTSTTGPITTTRHFYFAKNPTSLKWVDS
jgi:glucan phosphoethanolaminetransferase (alkaline phosphatase superfamily)